MDKFQKELKNPLTDYLSEEWKNLPRIGIRDGICTEPFIPYEGTAIPIPKNLVAGAEYLVGLNRPTQTSLTNLVSGIGRVLNNVVEILSFIAIYQNPLVEKNGKEAISQGEEASLKLEKLLENVLTQQVEQLEANRKNLVQNLQEIKELGSEKYDTLFEHQKSIVNILNENLAKGITKDIIQQLEKELNKRIIEENKTLRLEILEIKKIVQELNNKL